MNSDRVIPEDNLIEESDEEIAEAVLSSFELSEAEAADKVVQLLPVHAAPNRTGGRPAYHVDRRPGKQRAIQRMPTTSDLEYHGRILEEKAKFVDADPVVQASVRHVDPLTMLAVIRSEVAKESAALHFQRMENEKFGRDTSQVSSRRIDALKKIADIELELKKLGTDVLDVHSEKFQRVCQFWLDVVRESAESTMTPEQIDLFFNRLSTMMEGWEDKVSDLLR